MQRYNKKMIYAKKICIIAKFLVLLQPIYENILYHIRL